MKKQRYWLTDGLILTQNKKRDSFFGNILIQEGKIADITKTPLSHKNKEKKKSVAGLVLIPGLIQTHIHLCQTLYRNQADDLELLDWLSKKIWPMEANHTAFTMKTAALAGIYELLSSGTTCLLDMASVRHTEEVFKAVEKTGIRANIGKCLMDHPENNPKNLQEKSKEALAEAESLFKKWNGKSGDRIRASFAPRFAISCTEELMKSVSTLSKKYKAIIHTHASENKKEIEFVKKLSGRKNIDWLKDLGLVNERLVLAHGVWLEDSEIQTLAKNKSTVTHCPGSNLKLASGIADVPRLIQSGVNVSIGADGAPCNNTLNAFQEMKLAATLHKVKYGPKAMSAQEVLDMATINGAKALHWEDKIGSIEVGKSADLVALDLSQIENYSIDLSKVEKFLTKDQRERLVSALVYSAQPQHVRQTIVQGESLYESGVVKTISKKKLLRDIAKALEVLGS